MVDAKRFILMLALGVTPPIGVLGQDSGGLRERLSPGGGAMMPGGMPGLDGLPFNIPGLGGANAEADKPVAPVEPSAEALALLSEKLDQPLSLVSLGLGWLADERYVDAAEAFDTLRERHPDMAALALYNEGCVHYAAGDRALAEQYFERALAEPNASRIHRLATFNLGSIRIDRVAHRRDEVLPGLNPITNALQAGPERAWQAYAGAVERSIGDLSIASSMFRASLLADPNDHDALHNLRYARSQIVELRRERDAKRVEFEQFLTEIIQPQEALQKIMELSERQRELADDTREARRLRETPRSERIQEILSDQKRVTAETEDLLRRLDAMARRSDELFGEQNPLLAGLFDQLLGTGADAIADAVGAQRWADFELRGEEYEAAQDLQMQAHEDLRSIIEDFASQVENIEDLLRMFAEQMEQQVQQLEQDFEGQQLPQEGEGQREIEGPVVEATDDTARRILQKEEGDIRRRDAIERRRQRDRGENDW